jgi:hypothetical protein
MREDVMGGSCSTQGGDEKYIQNFDVSLGLSRERRSDTLNSNRENKDKEYKEDLKERGHLVDRDMRRMILK